MGPTQAICKDPSRWTFFDNLSFSWMFRWEKRSAWEGLVRPHVSNANVNLE
jgi:hypothetical protein